MKTALTFILCFACVLAPVSPLLACNGYCGNYNSNLIVASVSYVAPAIVVQPAPLVTYAVPAAAYQTAVAPAYAPAAVPAVVVQALPVISQQTLVLVSSYTASQQLAFFVNTYGFTIGNRLFNHHFGPRGVSRGLIGGRGIARTATGTRTAERARVERDRIERAIRGRR